MLTASKLAQQCGLSRSTLLYYESIGLIKPPLRTESNYRRYSEADVRRLRQICVYREAGLALSDICAILDRPEDHATAVLKRRLLSLDDEIEKLREHQRTILSLLRSTKDFTKGKIMTKDKWVSIMTAAGLSENDMQRWHVEFERSAPQDHQQFLEFLHIPPQEIQSIRAWSAQTH